MSIEEYKKALKRGERDRRRAASEGRHPYLTDLDSLVDEGLCAGREKAGLVDIPLDMVVGTVTRGRQVAFSRTFMPLLEAGSEFATKWSNLYDIQVSEGYRDPIVVIEFMHRFYVQEGNKRVSVLKYLGAPAVTAEVTRLYPSRWNTHETRMYGEFCEFWRACPLYDIELSHEGSYRRLARRFGRDLSQKWPREAVSYLHQTFSFFKSAYVRAGGDHLDITPADAMLIYLGVYTQDRLLDLASSIVVDRLGKIWRELVMEGRADGERVDLVEEPASQGEEDPAAAPSRGVLGFFMGKTAYSARRPLRVAFIHERPCSESAWAYVHDLGRQHIERYFGGIVRTSVYENRSYEDSFMDAVDAAAANGADVVFTTAPTLMDFTVKAAIQYPDVRFLNCSIGLPHHSVRSYYGKMYEAKFLLGALAASMADNHRIGYRVNSRNLGSVAEINAFAVGAELMDPEARVVLVYPPEGAGDLAALMRGRGLSVMSGSDVAGPYADGGAYGLHRLRGGSLEDIAWPVWHWDRYYELIVRSLLHGSWDAETSGDDARAVSYWYGMGSGVIDVRLSPGLPYQTKKLVRMLHEGIVAGTIHPFAGELHSQQGVVQLAGFPPLPSAEVVGMTWLADNVEGSLPDDADVEAAAVAAARAMGATGR